MTRKDDVKKLERLAWFLDSSIKIPFTNRTIGVDGLVGLVPGVGDVSSGLISGYIVLQAVKLGVSKIVIIRMLFNVLLESTIGAIPFFGDLFDFIFKSNQRNVNLMNEYLNSPTQISKRSGIQVGIALLLGILFLLLLIYLVFKIIGGLISIL